MTKLEGQKKHLEKMTIRELREVGLEMSEIKGVHGMNKAELINAIKKAKGIETVETKKKNRDVRELKRKMKQLKKDREKAVEQKDDKMAAIYRKKIIRMKKKVRRAA